MELSSPQWNQSGTLVSYLWAHLTSTSCYVETFQRMIRFWENRWSYIWAPFKGDFIRVITRTHFHLVPRSKNEWSYTSTPPICLHGVVLSKAQGQLYLYLYLYLFTWYEPVINSIAKCKCKPQHPVLKIIEIQLEVSEMKHGRTDMTSPLWVHFMHVIQRVRKKLIPVWS
jgi:hypothetical protein